MFFNRVISLCCRGSLKALGLIDFGAVSRFSKIILPGTAFRGFDLRLATLASCFNLYGFHAKLIISGMIEFTRKPGKHEESPKAA